MTAPSPTPNWTAALVEGDKINLWTLSASQTLRQSQSPRSAGPIEPDLCNALNQIGADPLAPVLLSGLDTAAVTPVPAKPGEPALEQRQLEDWHLYQLPSLSQDSPRAFMQAQSMQIAGFLALNPKWDGVICLPGTVTHWVLVSAAEVVSFQSSFTSGLASAMTGALGLEAAGQAPWSQSALTEAAADTMSRPERLASRLAELQSKRQLDDLEPTDARGKLWGYLIGADLAAARAYWLGQNLALIGAEDLASPYLAALNAQGVPVTQADPERMALQGLIQAWRHNFAPSDTD